MKRKIAAILMALVALIGIPVITAPAANAEAQICDWGVYPSAMSGRYISSYTASWAACTLTHSVQVRTQQYNNATGYWREVPGSAHYLVTANGGGRINQVPNAVYCPGNTYKLYRVDMTHLINGVAHHHSSQQENLPCSGVF